MLQAHGLSKTFTMRAERVVAVDDVAVSVAPGEFVCLQGASGSGKSTLIHLLAGLERVDSGQVCIDGVDMAAASVHEWARVRRSVMGLVFQNDNLIDEFKAWENVALPLEASGLPLQKARSEALEALRLVGIENLSDRFPSQMSGGQCQRVGIARALVGGKRILLADEPTGALDSQNSHGIYELLASLASHGCAVMAASHDSRCADYASRVITMSDGRCLNPSRAGG